MIVYVETNFVLELAYLRPTSDHCQQLLRLAADGRIALVVPSFTLIEARLAWQRNVKRRNRLHSDVRAELGELSRSRPLIDIASQSQSFLAALIDTADQDRTRLEAAVVTLLEQATVIPVAPEVVGRALAAERRLALSPQDAVIYTTVLAHARAQQGPKVFVTQNANDFRVREIEEELAEHDCKLLVAFDTAEAYIRSRIEP